MKRFIGSGLLTSFTILLVKLPFEEMGTRESLIVNTVMYLLLWGGIVLTFPKVEA